MLDCHLTAPFRILRAAQPVIKRLAKTKQTIQFLQIPDPGMSRLEVRTPGL